MRNAKIFSQSELPGASNIKRRASMQHNNLYEKGDAMLLDQGVRRKASWMIARSKTCCCVPEFDAGLVL